jgi:hypothetical protein
VTRKPAPVILPVLCGNEAPIGAVVLFLTVLAPARFYGDYNTGMVANDPDQ